MISSALGHSQPVYMTVAPACPTQAASSSVSEPTCITITLLRRCGIPTLPGEDTCGTSNSTAPAPGQPVPTVELGVITSLDDSDLSMPEDGSD